LTGGDGKDQFWIAAAEVLILPTQLPTQAGNDVIGIGGLPEVNRIGLSITQSDNTLINALDKDLTSLTGESTLGSEKFPLCLEAILRQQGRGECTTPLTLTLTPTETMASIQEPIRFATFNAC